MIRRAPDYETKIMPHPTVHECALAAKSAYTTDASAGPGIVQMFYGDLSSGFKGSYYQLNRPGAEAVICAFAGTEPETAEDILADVGFGAGIAPILGGIGAVLGAIGARQLEEQLYGATEMARQSIVHAQRLRMPVIVTGHSLGGGLASMVACRLGLPAVTCNAPATSQTGFRTCSQPICNVAIDGDPIKHTLRIGARIGTTFLLKTGRTGGAAHNIDNTCAALKAGAYASIGAQSALAPL